MRTLMRSMALVLCWQALLAGQSGDLLPIRLHRVLDHPRQLVVSDLDADGLPDAIVVDLDSDRVSVLPGLAGGGLGPACHLVVGLSPVGVVVADLDGDSVPDIVTCNGGSNDLSILIGTGTGSFLPEVRVTLGATPRAIAVGDLNGDSVLDLLVSITTTGFDSKVVFLPGLGDGGFGASVSTSLGLGTPVPTSLAVGDLDGDGVLDAVIGRGFLQSGLDVAFGVGDGNFTDLKLIGWGDLRLDVVITDVDQDGIQDIVTADGAAATVTVFFGLGNGTFSPVVLSAGFDKVRGVAVGDVNGDGLPDIATANELSGGVSVLLGTGGGAFAPAVAYGRALAPVAIAVADLGGNGVADLLFSSDGAPGAIGILRGLGDGSFLDMATFPVNKGSMAVSFADVNSDGLGDFLVPYINDFCDVCDGPTESQHIVHGHGVSMWVGSGEVAFVGGNWVIERDIDRAIMTDLDGDGLQDVVATTFLDDGLFSYFVVVALGQPGGSLGPEVYYYANGYKLTSLAASDLDGDGKPEIVVTTDPGSFIINDNVIVLPNLGDGSFGPAILYSTGGNPSEVATGDLDGDGNQDVAWLEGASGNKVVAFRLGDGNGALGPKVVLNVGAGASSLILARLDEDAVEDIVLVAQTDGVVNVVLSEGGGAFAPTTSYAAGSSPTALRVGDMDADGRLDLVVANSDATYVILRGAGSGSFAAPEIYASGIESMTSFDIGDFDQDGHPEVIGLTPGTSVQDLVVALRNTGGPWSDAGFGLTGSVGPPHLHGNGTLVAGTPVALRLSNAAVLATAGVFVGFDKALLAFKGGTLVPTADLLFAPLQTSEQGALILASTWPPGIPPGFEFHVQAWIQDGSAVHGYAASNGLTGVVP